MALVDELKFGLRQLKQPTQQQLTETARTAATGKARTGAGDVAKSTGMSRELATATGQQEVQRVEGMGALQAAAQEQQSDLQTQQFDKNRRQIQLDKQFALANQSAEERQKTDQLSFTYNKEARQTRARTELLLQQLDQKLKTGTDRVGINQIISELKHRVFLTNLSSKEKIADIHRVGTRQRLQDRAQFATESMEKALGHSWNILQSKYEFQMDELTKGLRFKEATQEMSLEAKKELADDLWKSAMIEGVFSSLGSAGAVAAGRYLGKKTNVSEKDVVGGAGFSAPSIKES